MADIFDDNDDGEVIDVGERSAPAQDDEPQAAAPQGPRPRLRAEWDGQGRCWVALFQGVKPLERWRPPTEEEWEALRDRGVLTRPSPVAPSAPPAAAGGPLSGLMDTVKSNAVPFVLGGGALWLVLKYLDGRKIPVDEIDSADDVEV